ncbi:MAG TPA: tetratricopeptide repeat protein [Myxococcota bacterium]|nr:tetratricopeptide repeat protein [Myxococcota bacterium]
MSRNARTRLTVAVLLILAAIALAWWVDAARRQRAPEAVQPILPRAASYIGADACGACHAEQLALWRGSHHDLAMTDATEATVLGDFSGARFVHAGVTSRFFQRDGRYFVETDGPGGALAEFEITHTFGVDPLQQYLAPLDSGRLQALSVAWDARAREAGGQRWFHLYGDEPIPHDDELHWTGPQQNWNFMCADCHSTNLRKGYDPTRATFSTTWSEVNVACEACHGPGSDHVAWAKAGENERAGDASQGLTASFAERKAQRWLLGVGDATAKPTSAQPLHAELEVCAPCHSRRTAIAEGFRAGDRFLDHYAPARLESPLYYADGQQRDEVYVWGSFVQSLMYQRGVTCSDCHEPHSAKLRYDGNALCGQCHSPARFDSAAHHRHAVGGAGAQCVACHMPETTYMRIDPRRDHSLRVPRPDLTTSLGVPNACSACHADRSAEWAAREVARWTGREPRGFQHFAEALAANDERIALVARDPAHPEIARATAAAALGDRLDATRLAAIRAALADESALVRRAALESLAALPPAERAALAAPLLDDPLRAVRIEAASAMADAAPSSLAPADGANFARAAAEYEAAQRMHSERPEHRTNLATFLALRGRSDEAEREFRAALGLAPAYAPAWVNLADLLRQLGRDAEAETLLRTGIAKMPDAAALHHVLGLTLVRLGRSAEALDELETAARLAPDDARFAYVHAVALGSAGERERALAVLDRALARNPRDTELLGAAAAISRDAGLHDRAIDYAERLVAVVPDDPGARSLVESLRAAPGAPH